MKTTGMNTISTISIEDAISTGRRRRGSRSRSKSKSKGNKIQCKYTPKKGCSRKKGHKTTARDRKMCGTPKLVKGKKKCSKKSSKKRRSKRRR